MPITIRALILACLAAAPFALRAQDATSPVMDPAPAPEPGAQPVDATVDGTGVKTGKGVTPMFAPMPFKNTQMGWGIMMMAGLIHRFDADTTIKPSTGAVFGFYSQNDSWGVGVGEMARLGHDTWRIRMLITHADINYRFFGIGEDAGNEGASIGVNQQMNFIVLSVLRRIAGHLYGGLDGILIQTSLNLNDTAGTALPPIPSQDLDARLFSPGLTFEYDTRDNDYYPYAGSVGRLRALFFTSALGGTLDFQRYVASWSWYESLGSRTWVLASNANVCATNGETPFFGLCSLGAGKGGLRGYEQGRYRDSAMTTLQTELRFHTSGRWAAVAFAGVGQVMPSLGDIFSTTLLPAGGVGVRYQMVTEYPMHMRVDYAWGKNGGILYFAAAEAF